jgi:hypothetical protein
MVGQLVDQYLLNPVRIARASVVQKQGDIEAHDDLDANTERLAVVLAHIGRSEKSIRPSVLEKYPALLACPRVQGRAGPNATTSQRAQAANVEIIAAINELVLSADRAIAAAVICSESQYEGLKVYQRKELLEKSADCISPDQFKRRRPIVITELAMALERGPDRAAPETGRLVKDPSQDYSRRRREDSEYEPRLVAARAARLHFDSIAVRLADGAIPTTYIDVLSRDDQWRFDYYIRDECCKALFQSFADIVEVHRYFPDTFLQRRIAPITQQILLLGPRLTPRDQQRITDSGETARLLLLSELILGTGSLEIYETKFLPWLHSQISRYDPNARMPQCDLERLISRTADLVKIANAGLEPREAALAQARRDARRRLCLHYPGDEWVPHVQGQPFSSYVSVYLESESARLTNMSNMQ